MGGTLALDQLTGAMISLSFLYMMVAVVAVWCLGERKGLALVLSGVICSLVLKHYQLAAIDLHGRDVGLGSQVWNGFARMLSVTLIGLVANGLRAALALERWRASHDGLTGALNKRAFQERAAMLVKRARVQNRSLVLAYMDLDGFKSVNDRHGHSAGDRVLCAFAEGAGAAVRQADLFARIGGDEFVALMSVRTCEEGDQVAEMLHSRLSGVLRDTGFPVTCSMGAMVSESRNFDLGDNGLEAADMLMYEVKASGKNALRVARGSGLKAILHRAYPLTPEPSLMTALAAIDDDRTLRQPECERRHVA